jgi:CMP-N,N'-diacetyllegionaminic acid synthase
VRVLGVVPARGGSKGLPRKNLLLLAGEPLLVHTLRSARQARTLDHIVVSTDDDELAAVARAAGVEVVERPAELATDDASTEDALIHVLETLEARGESTPEFVVTLEPTSPLRTGRLIDECVETAIAVGADALITVAETRELYGRVEGGRFAYLMPGQPRRRQEREPLYRESSTVYVTRTSHLRSTRSVLADTLYVVVASEEEAIDVNSARDLLVAEAALRLRGETGGAL